MRRLTLLAATMLAMVVFATSPALAQTIDQSEETSVSEETTTTTTIVSNAAEVTQVGQTVVQEQTGTQSVTTQTAGDDAAVAQTQEFGDITVGDTTQIVNQIAAGGDISFVH